MERQSSGTLSRSIVAMLVVREGHFGAPWAPDVSGQAPVWTLAGRGRHQSATQATPESTVCPLGDVFRGVSSSIRERVRTGCVEHGPQAGEGRDLCQLRFFRRLRSGFSTAS